MDWIALNPETGFMLYSALLLLKSRRTYRLDMIYRQQPYIWAMPSMKCSESMVQRFFASMSQSHINYIIVLVPEYFNPSPKSHGLRLLAHYTNFLVEFRSNSLDMTCWIKSMPSYNIIKTQCFLIDRILEKILPRRRSYRGSDNRQAK